MKAWNKVFWTGITLLLPTMAPVASAATMDAAETTRRQMNEVGSAMLSYLTDAVGRVGREVDVIPRIEGYCLWQGPDFDREARAPISHNELQALLVPLYLESLPQHDAWGHAFEYQLDDNILGSNVLAILSPGADGIFEGRFYGGSYTSSADDDLVWADAYFVRQPPTPVEKYPQRAEEEMRVVGVALTSWYADQVGQLPPTPSGQSITLDPRDRITHFELLQNLMPSPTFFYTRCAPELDPWGQAYEYYIDSELLVNQVLAIRTAGADGLVEGDTYDRQWVTDSNGDLVWVDGIFFRRPALSADGFESGDLSGWSAALP